MLEFWKFPGDISRMTSVQNGWTAIGCRVPEKLSADSEPARLHVLDNGSSIYASVSRVAPGSEWEPLLYCADPSRMPLAWSTQDHRHFLFAFDLDRVVTDLLTEEYRRQDGRATVLQLLHRLYYRARPLIPRAIQMRMKRAYTDVQADLEFPQWPLDDSLELLRRLFAWCVVRSSGMESLPHIAFWPRGKRFCVVLTHDVETQAGVANIPVLAEIERRLGFRSSWNFVPERYPFDEAVLKELQDDGFEVGVHGLHHDGRLFESRRRFARRATRINGHAERWGAMGFRSPACHRNAEWMKAGALRFSYDSSFPDTDPYQPMPGGCCSVFPWMLGDMVELPVTMPQDHVLFDVLTDPSGELWRRKLEYIENAGGMAVLIVHPDYMRSDERLQLYERFLIHLKDKESAWFALPRDVAEWWRMRFASTLIDVGGAFHIEGPLGTREDALPSVEMLATGPLPGELVVEAPALVRI